MRYASIIVVSIVLIAPVVAFAAAPDSSLGKILPGATIIGEAPPSGGGSYNEDTITGKITGLVNWFSWGIALVSVVMGLYAGFLFITARGEAAQLKTARATLLWAVIGVAVAVLAFSIIAITKAIFTLG